MPKNYADLLDLEKRFEQYLDLVQLKKETMHPIQLQETRRAFMGGVGSLLVLLMTDLDGLNEEESLNSLTFLMQEVDKFWKTESTTPYP